MEVIGKPSPTLYRSTAGAFQRPHGGSKDLVLVVSTVDDHRDADYTSNPFTQNLMSLVDALDRMSWALKSTWEIG